VTIGPRRPGALCLALLIGILASNLARAQSPPTPDRSDAAAIGSTLSSDLLRNLPSSNNLFQLLETVEGEVISDRFYGGGLNTGRLARDGGFLSSWRQTQYFVDGVNVTLPADGAPFLFPIVPLWESADVESAMMPAGRNVPGLAVALVPTRPGKSWTRIVEASGAGKSFVAGTASGAPPAIETLTQWSHGNVFVSGPLSPRAGLVAAIDWSGTRQVERTGASQADGQAASVFAHVVYALNSTDELRTVGWVQRTQTPFAAATVFQRPLAADQTTFTHIQSTWERRAASGATWSVFGSYSQAAGTRDQALSNVASVERLLDGPVPYLVDTGDRTDTDWSAGLHVVSGRRGSGGHSHRFLVNADVGRSASRMGPGFSGSVAESVDGTPARVWAYSNGGIDSRRHAVSVSAYAGDRIDFGVDRVVELGVHYDGANGSADGASTPVSWHNLLPRVSFRWKQGRSSHVTWVAGYRRAADRLTLDTLAVGDPAAETAFVSRLSSGVSLPVVVARVGPGTGGDPNLSGIDPALARPTTDEVVAGVDIQLTPHIRGRLTGIAKRVHHLYNLVDVGAPASSYSVFNVVDGRPASDGGDVLLPVYSRLPSTFGADRYLLTNNSTDDTATFEALALNGEASVGRLTLMLNATASQTDGPATNRGFHADENDISGVGELFVNPNATSSARGRLFYDRAFTLKLTGLYRFPHGVMFAAIARYQDGEPFSRVTVVPGATSSFQPTQGTEFVRAYPAGDARFMYTGTLDLRLQKQIAAGRIAFDVFIDAYNVINLGNEVEERVVTGPGFRDITAIQPPAAVHVGLRLHF
jgi:hypothetical protein